MPDSHAYFAGCNKYEVAELREHLAQGLSRLGLDGKIRSGDRVLLKPNLVLGKAPELAVTTHPAIIHAVGSLLKDCGARLAIGDSPGFGSLSSCLERCGLNPVIADLGIEPVELNQEKEIRVEALPGGRLQLAARAFDFDHLVNLPKLKTHAMMGMTLAVKNLFGLVPGFNKARWHFRAGHNRRLFARFILEIYRALPPTWNLLDGIVAMDGDGPTSGRARDCGLLAISADAATLDYQVEKWLELHQHSPICQVALELGMIEPEAKILGPGADIRIKSPLQPAPGSQQALFPLQRWWGRFFVRKVKISSSRCRRCLVCVDHCPAKAMSFKHGRIMIDQKKCIHCYCCQELCQYGAVSLR